MIAAWPWSARSRSPAASLGDDVRVPRARRRCCAALRPPLGIADRTRSGRDYGLTFDDGPHREGTPAVLEVLERHGVHATFFLVGEQVARNPSLAAEIVAAGHEIGLHCDRHRNQLRLGPRAVRADIERGAARIEETTGRPIDALPPALRDLQRHGARARAPQRLAPAAVDALGARLGGARDAGVDHRAPRRRRGRRGLGAAAARRRRLLGARGPGGAPRRALPRRALQRSSAAGCARRSTSSDARTRVPCRGAKVMLRRATASGARVAGRQAHAREHASTSTTRISSSANAAPRQRRIAAAERDPAVGGGCPVEKALGAELERLGIEVRPRVGQPDRGRHVGARRQRVAAGAKLATRGGARRAAAPGAAAATRRSPRAASRSPPSASSAVSRRSVAGECVSRSNVHASAVAVVSWPASSSVTSWSRSSRSLIAAAVLEARGEQEREDVLAPGRSPPFRRSLRAAARRSRARAPAKRLERVAPAEPPREQHAEAEDRRGGAVEQSRKQLAQPLEPAARR